MINRELRDELEVPGEVLGYEVLSVKDATVEVRHIIDKWEPKGAKCVNDIPDRADRERALMLMSLINKRRMY